MPLQRVSAEDQNGAALKTMTADDRRRYTKLIVEIDSQYLCV